jgi:hypothetical protein
VLDADAAIAAGQASPLAGRLRDAAAAITLGAQRERKRGEFLGGKCCGGSDASWEGIGLHIYRLRAR